jgi:flagellar protein FlaG
MSSFKTRDEEAAPFPAPLLKENPSRMMGLYKHGGSTMSITLAPLGNSPQQEIRREIFPQDHGAARIAQAQAAEIKAAAIQRFESSLPGNREDGEKPVEISQTAADLEQISLAFDKKLKFVVDHESHEVTVKVIDSTTDKVIKVLPPEELQRLHSRIKETIGFLFDEKV